MAENTYTNKVIYGGDTLIDLTADDVTRSDVLSGMKFHLPSGEPTTGTCTYDADTQDANAIAAEILTTKTAYVKGSKITGSMPNNGAVSGTISTKAGQYTVPQGYHDGSGKVGIDSTEQAKIIEGNIKAGIEILGVTGTYSGEAVTAGAVDVTPYTTSQTILPSSISKDYISQVNVAAIAKTETDNDAGGVTVTIGSVAPA
jgi:hypothetical protein